MTAYYVLAEHYDAGRTGYSNELYDALSAFGFARSGAVLDLGCGTGLASLPFAQGGFRVTGIDASEKMIAKARENAPLAHWVVGTAEALPFPDGSFQAVLAAQAFHHFDRAAAMREVVRVLAPRGVAAFWWKHLMHDDPVRQMRESVLREMGFDPPESGLVGGFREFYAADFAEHTLRVLPWHASVQLERYVSYERSRRTLVEAVGGRLNDYIERLERQIRAYVGAGNPSIPLHYTQYLYLGRKA